MPQLAVVHTFWTDYEQLEKPVRAGVRKAITKFQSLTVAELYADKGLGLSVARMARDPRMRTIRITAFWRGVLLAPDDGSETFLLLKVLPHDEALQWAATRLVSVNSAMGSLEVRDVVAMERLVTSRPASHAPTTLFARFSVTDLTALGIDGQTLEAIRTITGRAQFDAFQPLLPEDQREVLQYLAEGFEPAEVFQNVVAPRRPADANPPASVSLADAIAHTSDRITLFSEAGELEEIAGKPLVAPRTGELLSPSRRGERKDYACERLPLADGGQANVFKAVHKPSGKVVILKKLKDKYPPARQVARMKREIECGRSLIGNPHAMPILDFDPKYTWFVMPYAEATAESCQEEFSDDAALRELLESLCSVLAVAHHEGWIHRDIKPANVLRLKGRWVLADWGIVRRPLGQTTDPQRTRVGVFLGSEGFAAPEHYNDAHHAGPTADIYSLGQLIGWAVTGEMPLVNVPLLPKSGPWRAIVREATQRDPERRPATVSAFLDFVAQELDEPAEPVVLRGEHLQRELFAGPTGAGADLLTLAATHPDDAALYFDVLIKVPVASIMADLLADAARAVEVVSAMATLFGTDVSHGSEELGATVKWLASIAEEAARARELDLLEACCGGAFEWIPLLDDQSGQAEGFSWWTTLSGDAASSVAAMLRQHPESVMYFGHLAHDLRVDHRIRAAIAQQ
ncbi:MULTISPECIES: serine/threonine-protein kinase [Streptomyces]|uniref:non-specific serine/threonine protein kinase n=1 Tax=Streptomyces glycanivorans TaxID=3033808 RepID=A0ABY9JND7_9ACTN|nr:MULTISPECIES: serine/threonine-protein kinase [unclassified Streptomyces]WLQ69202.1 serine/threonine-protein kinase [Streptomyces sp. Alt3]WSR53522.1 serine/threonine protein kinase [Streptomyces sp. NBC_01201]